MRMLLLIVRKVTPSAMLLYPRELELFRRNAADKEREVYSGTRVCGLAWCGFPLS